MREIIVVYDEGCPDGDGMEETRYFLDSDFSVAARSTENRAENEALFSRIRKTAIFYALILDPRRNFIEFGYANSLCAYCGTCTYVSLFSAILA